MRLFNYNPMNISKIKFLRHFKNICHFFEYDKHLSTLAALKAEMQHNLMNKQIVKKGNTTTIIP
jgi:hypothetical protein